MNAKWFHMYLSSIMKNKRVTISQFILCVLMFFMRFRLPLQNAFQNSCQHSTTKLGQKGYLSMIFQMLFKKMFFFLILQNNLVHVPEGGTLLYCVGHASVAQYSLWRFICQCTFTAISRKVVGKSARNNPERYCGWF